MPQCGDLKPLEVFHGAAAVADKVMMRIEYCVVTGGAGIELKFAHEAGFHERMQCVVDGGSGSADAAFFQRRPEIVDGGMVGMAQKVIEKGDPLRRAPQASAELKSFCLIEALR